MKSGFTHQNLFAYLIVSALFAVSSSIAVFAQPAIQQSPAPKVNLIIERNLLRFETPSESRIWQIEVFNKAGDLIFGSGVVNNTTLEWPLEDQQGQPLA